MTDQSASLSYIPIQAGCAGPILTTMSQNIPNTPGKYSFSTKLNWLTET